MDKISGQASRGFCPSDGGVLRSRRYCSSACQRGFGSDTRSIWRAQVRRMIGGGKKQTETRSGSCQRGTQSHQAKRRTNQCTGLASNGHKEHESQSGNSALPLMIKGLSSPLQLLLETNSRHVVRRLPLWGLP